MQHTKNLKSKDYFCKNIKFETWKKFISIIWRNSCKAIEPSSDFKTFILQRTTNHKGKKGKDDAHAKRKGKGFLWPRPVQVDRLKSAGVCAVREPVRIDERSTGTRPSLIRASAPLVPLQATFCPCRLRTQHSRRLHELSSV
jgi:hypothetical protein